MHGGDPMNRNSMSYTPNNGNIMNSMDYQQQQQQPQQELELNWDPTRVKSELLKASAVLSHRCLKLAGKWAAEQVTGIPVGTVHPVVSGSKSNSLEDADVDLSYDLDQQQVSPEEEDPSLSMIRELSMMSAEDWYAKSLFDLGEFLHAASVLSSNSAQS